MSDERNDALFNFTVGLFLGAALGASVALLTAPQSGKRTRKRLGRAAGDIRRNYGDRWDELAEDVKGRVDEAVSGAKKRLGQG
jgi:gas vesicle protein